MLYISVVMLYIVILLIYNSFNTLVDREGYSENNCRPILNTMDCDF